MKRNQTSDPKGTQDTISAILASLTTETSVPCLFAYDRKGRFFSFSFEPLSDTMAPRPCTLKSGTERTQGTVPATWACIHLIQSLNRDLYGGLRVDEFGNPSSVPFQGCYLYHLTVPGMDALLDHARRKLSPW